MKMHAAVFYGKNDVRYEEVPVPKIGSEEALIKVDTCGLCKTDVKKIVHGILAGPRIFGHEIVGTIEKVGSNVKNVSAGDRVAVFHHVPCLSCEYCLAGNFSQCHVYKQVDTTAGFTPSGGGFAEYVKAPELVVKRGLVKIPDEVSFEEAVFIEPTNCCLKAIKKAQVSIGDTVMVLGQGPIGLTHVQLIRLAGGKPIATDLVDYRLEKALELGAEHAFNAANEDVVEKIKKVTGGKGVDSAIVAVESIEAIEQAIAATKKGGKVVFFSETEEGQFINLNPNIVYGSEITLLGSYSSSFREQSLSAQLIFEKKIATTELISHRFKFNRLLDAVNLAIHRRSLDWSKKKTCEKVEQSFKIVLKP